MSEAPKTLVLGLGNPLLTDDSVGLRLAERLRPLLAGRPGIEVDVDYWGGLRLMERLVGYDRAIVLDAICSGAAPGTLFRLGPADVPTEHSASAHDVNLPTALALGRQMGAKLPQDNAILLIALEAADTFSFSESLTPQVEAALPLAEQAVLQALELEMSPP
jgi:hydrogenase maturation protease